MSSVVRGPTIDLISTPVPELSSTSDVPTVDSQVSEGPPVSATSDETPDAPTPMKVVEKEAEGEKTEPETTAADKKADADVTKDADKIEPKKTKKSIDERFSEVTAQRRAAEERAANEETARRAAEARADTLEKQQKEILTRLDRIAPPVDQDPRPQRAQFDDPNKYDEALMGWSQRQGEKLGRTTAEQEFKTKTEADQRKANEDAQKADNDRIAKAYAERVDKIKESEPDYDDLVTSPDLPISQAVGAAIITMEDGPKIALHLAKNPTDAKRIYELAPMAQIYEIGKIAAALNAPPKTTKAPDPLDTLKSGANAASKKSANEESMSEYASRRQSELASERANKTPKRA